MLEPVGWRWGYCYYQVYEKEAQGKTQLVRPADLGYTNYF